MEFKPGSLGPGLPRRALVVSPQHCIVIQPAGMGGSEARLVPAKGLLHLPGVRQKKGCRKVEYFHLVFDRHEIILSEGVWAESFFPGPVALGTLRRDVAIEVAEILGIDVDTPNLDRYTDLHLLSMSDAKELINVTTPTHLAENFSHRHSPAVGF